MVDDFDTQVTPEEITQEEWEIFRELNERFDDYEEENLKN